MPARPDRRQLGAAAEALACATLEHAGLVTLARNVNYRFGELDLVMRDGDTLVFVEVRYRSSDRFGGAAGSVDHGKRRRMVLAARAWLSRQREFTDAPCRFDVVTAQGAEGMLQARWLRNAFSLEDV
ncbi:YraN family protein [Arenimonas sp. MALMAid1274]|uniref:YraN family protein n=1 Tax=Arenimonas sp. MALMAid1274 TaxID=3411630 RepID=UPI003BA353D9